MGGLASVRSADVTRLTFVQSSAALHPTALRSVTTISIAKSQSGPGEHYAAPRQRVGVIRADPVAVPDRLRAEAVQPRLTPGNLRDDSTALSPPRASDGATGGR